MSDRHELVRRREPGRVRRGMMVLAAVVAGLGAPFVAPTAAHAETACPTWETGYYGEYICQYGRTYPHWLDGHWQLFIVGTNHRVYDSWQMSTGAWTSWRDLGGDARSPIDWRFPTANTIDIKVWGTTSSYWCKSSKPDGSWNPWRACTW